MLAAGEIARICGRLALAGWDAAAGPAQADPADLLLTLCAAVAAVLAGWLALGTLAAVLAQAPGLAGRCGRVVAGRLAPAALRRTVAFLLGTAVLAAVAPGTAVAAAYGDRRPEPTATATAGPTTTAGSTETLAPTETLEPTASPRVDPSAVGAAALPPAPDPGFHPRTVAATPPAATAPAAPAAAPTAPSAPSAPTSLGPLGPAPRDASDPDRVVVRRGESLWSIAARHLGPAATAGDIAREWPRWYAANRSVIGPDPDLIEPGQVLLAPGWTR